MKFETTPAFDGDVRRLKRSGQYEAFRQVIHEVFITAAERRIEDPGRAWPSSLRVKGVQAARGVLEMTWDWPDGRATFEWVNIDGASGIRWRRVGSHAIFDDA